MPNMKRTLVVMGAVLAISATGIAGSHAGGATKAAKAAKPAKPAKVGMPAKVPKTAVNGMTMKAAAKKGPGMCGTFMYWKGGKCEDARLKK